MYEKQPQEKKIGKQAKHSIKEKQNKFQRK